MLEQATLFETHPSRVRELKQFLPYELGGMPESHPSRVRELKLRIKGDAVTLPGSHPSRVRELKPDLESGVLLPGAVAPLAGA